jgi:hypothetical protein
MCVDDQLLSAFIDGELDGNHSEQVKVHLAECSDCRKRMEGMRRISAALSSGTLREEDIALSSRRVAARLDHVIDPASSRGFWSRRFSVPAPLALAAMLVLVLVSGMFALSLYDSGRAGAGGTGAFPLAVGDYSKEFKLLASDMDAPDSGPTIQQLFELLGSSGASIEVKIDLPSESVFTVHGEPQLLRAADFQRSDFR